MTSSEVGSADAAPAPAAAPVLTEGHLHPGILFLRFLDGVRGSALLALLALISGSLQLVVLVLLWFVLTMAHAVARYVTFRYRLTTEELVTTEGILQRQERRIPVNRIQDVSFEQSILRRMIGLVVVSVETASGKGAEAKLDSLGRRQAEALREALLLQRHSAAAPVEGEPEQLVHRVTGGELVLRGLTNNRLGVILASLFGLWELSNQFGLDRLLFGPTFERMFGLTPWVLALTVAALVATALLAGWMVSVITSLVMFWDFRLTRRGDVFQRRHGLITTRARSLPQRKIQRVLVEQNLVRRLLDVAVVRADSAGSGQDPSAQEASGLDVVVPLAQPQRIAPILPALLPGLERERPAWHGAARAVVVRTTLQAGILAAVAVLLLAPGAGMASLMALVLVPLGWLVGVLLHRNLAYALGHEHVLLRWGVVGRYHGFVPLRKVQAVTLRAGPLERGLGLARLTVYVAGGSPSTLTNLSADAAHRLKLEIARAAAARRFVW